MDIKRYEVDLEPLTGGVDWSIEVTEDLEGDWCKYEDIEVVLQVLKTNLIDLQRELKETNKQIREDFEQIQEWVAEMEINAKQDVDYFSDTYENIDDIKSKYKE